MLWEDVIHISGIANPHIQDLRIANPLVRGMKKRRHGKGDCKSAGTGDNLDQKINWRYNKNQ